MFSRPATAPPRSRNPSPAEAELAKLDNRRRERHRRQVAADAYQRKKETERERQATKSRRGRDIGPLPPVANPKRRAKAEKSLRVFLETYFAGDFRLKWSRDHLKLIKALERKIISGGLQAFAMPRGSGKTTILERASLWAMLTGRRSFIVLIGATGDAAVELLDNVKAELETNDRLAEDFPETCHPIRALEGINHRAKGQHIDGQRTQIKWDGLTIALPTVKGSKSSGATVAARGLLGRIRGLKRKTDGRTVRPDFIFVDDPQTDASARSAYQNDKRLRVLTGAILGLAGPKVKLAGFLAATVIQPADAADQILDRQAHPNWDGLRTRLLYGSPQNAELVEEYQAKRAEDMRTGSNTATPFYKKNLARIEAGLEAAWPERKEPGDLTATQHALNLQADRGKEIFDLEYNNDTAEALAASADDWHIPAEEIATRLSGLARGVAPLWGTRITAQIDLQQRLLYWVATAWDDSASNPRGSIVDYGTWPEQPGRDLGYRNARRTLARAYPGRGIKAALRQGLADLVERLLDARLKREDKAEQRIGLVGIDAGNWSDLVHEFARTHKRGQLLIPTKGAGITADKRPMSEWKKSKGMTIGNEWVLTPAPKHASRLLLFDANHWKRELFVKLSTPLGDPGGLTIYGSDPAEHKQLAQQLTSEKPTRTEGNGRTVFIFSQPPHRPDNHLLDCATGALVLTLNNPTGRRRARPRGKRKARPI